MKAMILAAGRGERLRPLTDTLPKPLVSVKGKPLIVYHLEKLAAIGVKEVVINHAWLGHKLIETLGSGQNWGLTIHYSAETEALETAGGIKNALAFLGDEAFLVINGDVFIDRLPVLPDMSRISPEKHCLAHLWLVENPPQHPHGDFGFQSSVEMHADDGLIEASVIADAEVKFTFSGMGIYHPRLFDDIGAGAVPLGPLLREKMALGQVRGQLHTGFWCDVGTLDRLAQLEDSIS